MTYVSRAALAALATALALPAAAQQAAAPAPARPSNPGPAIAGVCVFDEHRALLTSAAGKAYTARMQQLGQAVDAELRPQRTTLETEANAFNSQQASLTADVRTQRAQALQTRVNAYQTLVQTRQAELAETERTQIRRIATEMQPVIAQVYVQRGCGLMLDRGSVVYANPAMEVTDAVVTGLNSRLPTLTFERSRAPAAAAAPASGAAARPATPAPATPAPRR